MSGGIPTYGPEEIGRRLERTLPAWRYERGWIRRRWDREGWPASILSAGAIAYLAEAGYHHPDLILTADGVAVKLRHHFAAGITDLDLALAETLEGLLAWRSDAAETAEAAETGSAGIDPEPPG